MTDEKDVKNLADNFFQNESYVGDSEKGSYKQVNLDTIIPLIKRVDTKHLVAAYNIALKRIIELIDRKLNALFYLGKSKKFDLKEYLDLEIPNIHQYLIRIYDIRNAILIANSRNINISQKKSNINRLFGEFDDIFFLEDEIYKFIPLNNQNDKKVIEFVEYVKKEYIKYFEKETVSKVK